MDNDPFLHSMYVSNLPTSCTEEELYEAFSKYGDIGEVFVQSATEGRFTYGFVRYFEQKSMETALQLSSLRPPMMKGRSLVVQKSKEPMSKPKKFFMQPFTRKCCSSNLPDDISRLTEVKQTYFKVKESEETLPGFDDIITMKDKESNSLAPKTKVEFEGFVMELAKLDKLVFQSLVQRNKDSKG